MKTKFPVFTSVAMGVAGIGNLQFNEAVSRGYYRPLADSVQGKPREFDETEMIGLFVMGALLRSVFDLPFAASRAQACRDLVVQCPAAKEFRISFQFPKGEINWTNQHPPKKKDAERIEYSIVFEIPKIRRTILKRIDELGA